MPYIKKEDRLAIGLERDAETPGELNYQITLMLNDYIIYKGLSYATLNEVVGVLECAKQELFRRIINQYEHRKSIENGDVFAKSLTD